jgi:septal ring factor EnvC (AmiA/AmiB activator)
MEQSQGGQAVSDTPRTDAAEYESQDEPAAKLGAVDAEFARTLERELNATNAEIERLTNKVAQLYEGAEESKQRIKQLEEAGDALCAAAAFMGWHMEIEKWNKAKEDKP